jgi:uncharacterized protein (TIGR03790 family)
VSVAGHLRTLTDPIFVIASALALAIPGVAAAQTGASVLVVINHTSSASETIGRQYAERRGVPEDNLCVLPLPLDESVSREVYDTQIEQPIWACIANRQAQDRILYIVLTKDVPIRIKGTSGRSGTNASVDSELTLLYRRRTGESVPIVGFVPNPYFAGAKASATVEPFTHRPHDIYLVTRLDGYTLQDALALIDRAAAPTAEGVFVLDRQAAKADLIPNRWLGAAAERLTAQGLGNRIASAAPAAGSSGTFGLVGYYSWGANAEGNRRRAADVTFYPGALAGMFVSTDGRTFKEPPASWLPGDNAPDARFAGTSDPLAADLIRAGATGVSAHVDEPYLDASIRPDILFPAYASGRNLAESFYAAMPYLSWQTLIIGDPLCAPFPHQPLAADATNPPIDAATELPAEFSRRKLANVYPAISRTAVAAFMQFQSRVLRGDTAGARVALEGAIAAEPRFIPARIELALIDDREGDREAAIAQYRAILSYSPNDPLALNNLAYALAVYRNNPEEALPIAQRATVVAREDPALLGGASISNYYSLGTYRREPLVPYSLDTLAWVQHLLGRHIEAASTIREALAADGFAPDLRWHAAIIYAAVDDMHQASAELSAAVTADPTLLNRAEIQKLQQQLNARKF